MRTALPFCLVAVLLAGTEARAASNTEVENVTVTGKKPGYATQARTRQKDVDLGPLGRQPVQQTPFMIQSATQDVSVNQQARNLSDLMQYLPSVQIEARGGANLGRPQARGFESDVVSNTRIDGLNAVETTAYPAEQFDNLSVLTGIAGGLYGPQNPAGIFNYTLKRPTDTRLDRAVIGFDGLGLVSEALDAGGRVGKNGWLGYRISLVYGDGTNYVRGSTVERNLASASFDIRLDPDTTIQLDGSQYVYDERGNAPSYTYAATINLPAAPDLSVPYASQDYSGFNTETDTGIARILHKFNENWSVTLGGLYQEAHRDVFSITNTLLNNTGAYSSAIAAAATAKDFVVGSNIAYLNGHVATGPLTHDLVLGTNGYRESNINPTVGQTFQLGSATLDDPQAFAGRQPYYSGNYTSAFIQQQALVFGDTAHLAPHWAVMPMFSVSWLSSTNYNVAGKTTSESSASGAFSPMVALIYTPNERNTVYFTYASSLQAGGTAPSTVVNANAVLAPYRSEQYELGYKFFLRSMQIQTALFRISRPFGFTDPASNVYSDQGIQTNSGFEFYASGHLTPALAALGGFTLIDPQLGNTGNARTSNKEVVGVSPVQANVLLDYTLPLPSTSVLNGLAVNANVHYASKRAANVYNTSYASGYATLDLGARMTLPTVHGTTLTARIGVTNVTGERYWLSLYPNSADGGTGTNSAFPGLPRLVHASLEADF